MFYHVVLMTFSPTADQSFHNEVERYCEQVRRTARNCSQYVYRENLASRADGLTHAILSAFASAADHDAYQVSTVHQQMKAYMAPYIARIVVCDIDGAMS